MKILKLSALIYFCFISFISKAQLETEESKPLVPHQWELGGAMEFQTSKEGTENAIPLSIEYGLSKKFTLLVEPVVYTFIKPKNDLKASANGVGDLEVTLFYQLISEEKYWLSLSVSGEIKFPTAKNSLIGTGKTDYTPFFIASKTSGKFYTSLNLSYTFLGKPDSVTVNNLFNYALGTKFTISPKHILFAEIYGNTSALSNTEGPEGQTLSSTNNSELSGGETVGSIGYGFYPTPNLQLSFSVSYDNNNAILFRPGVIWLVGGKKNN